MVEMKSEDRPDNFWQLLRKSTEKTGVQGVSNINQARGLVRRTFWATVVVAGFGLLAWQVNRACVKYFTYPVNTRTLQHSARSFEFPAVTFCNLNPLRQSELRDDLGGLGRMFTAFANPNASNETWPHAKPKSTALPPTAKETNDTRVRRYAVGGDGSSGDGVSDDGESGDDYSGSGSGGSGYDGNDLYDDHFAKETPEFQMVERFGALFSTLPRKQRIRAGHQLTDMLLKCSWNGRPCNAKNFTTFNHYLYGNCYTFNGAANSAVLTSTRTGPLYGLSMRLFVEQYEYMASLSDSAGVRLVVHPQTSMPFPEDDGISISPSTKTFVGLRRYKTKRMGYPYGNCIEYTTMENVRRNAYVSDVPTVEYSVQACMKTCFQLYLLKDCGCYSSHHPFGKKIAAYTSVKTDGLLPCDDQSLKQETREKFLKCEENIEKMYDNDSLRCSRTCQPRCSDIDYSYSISQSAWPSDVKKIRILGELYGRSAYMRGLSIKEQENFATLNVLALEIYFQSFHFEELRTEPSYDVSDLFADIGGQGGLWLGVSAVAMCELIELLIDFIILSFSRLATVRGRKSVSPVTTIEQ